MQRRLDPSTRRWSALALVALAGGCAIERSSSRLEERTIRAELTHDMLDEGGLVVVGYTSAVHELPLDDRMAQADALAEVLVGMGAVKEVASCRDLAAALGQDAYVRLLEAFRVTGELTAEQLIDLDEASSVRYAAIVRLEEDTEEHVPFQSPAQDEPDLRTYRHVTMALSVYDLSTKQLVSRYAVRQSKWIDAIEKGKAEGKPMKALFRPPEYVEAPPLDDVVHEGFEELVRQL